MGGIKGGNKGSDTRKRNFYKKENTSGEKESDEIMNVERRKENLGDFLEKQRRRKIYKKNIEV